MPFPEPEIPEKPDRAPDRIRIKPEREQFRERSEVNSKTPGKILNTVYFPKTG